MAVVVVELPGVNVFMDRVPPWCFSDASVFWLKVMDDAWCGSVPLCGLLQFLSWHSWRMYFIQMSAAIICLCMSVDPFSILRNKPQHRRRLAGCALIHSAFGTFFCLQVLTPPALFWHVIDFEGRSAGSVLTLFVVLAANLQYCPVRFSQWHYSWVIMHCA